MAKVIKSLDALPESKQKFLDDLKALSNHKNYQMRLLFIKMAVRSLSQLPHELFHQVFFVPLLLLAEDRVVNIRMFVGDALRKIAQNDQ